MLPYKYSLKAVMGLALGLVLTVSGWALEEVELEVVRSLNNGINKTWLTQDPDGKLWFVKRDGPVDGHGGQVWINYGNFEAEILASRLFRDFGLLSPRVEPIRIKGASQVFLRAEWADESFTGAGKPMGIRELPDREGLDQVRLLQVLDVVLGNGDRHEENLLFVRNAEGTLIPIPIDNNLALSDRSVVAYGSWQFNFHRELTNIDHLMQRNSVYAAVGRMEGASTDYVRIARLVRERLTDDYLAELVGAIDPEVITHGNPAKRKRDILRKIQSRRDRLPRYFDQAYFEGDRARDRDLIDNLEAVVPREVRVRLQLGAFQNLYLAMALDPEQDFDPAETYFRLRAVTGDTLVAREILKSACESRGVPFPLEHVLTVEDGFSLPGQARAIRAFLEEPLQGIEPLD